MATPTPAASLADGASLALNNVQIRFFNNENVIALAITWANALAGAGIDPENAGGRTVLD